MLMSPDKSHVSENIDNRLNENKLLTFALFAYNQEQFIGEAIKGALSQTYSPLEIILSDDCSRDGTFQIMQEMVNRYTGPHKVCLNRNQENMGIVGHVNKVVELARGELIVAAGGDDISFPNRVEKTFSLWNAHDQKPDLVYFNYEPFGTNPYAYQINPQHHSLEYQIKNGGAHLKGATAAYTKRLFDIFGPIQPWIFAEDKSIPFRAALCGGIVCVDEPIIKYRVEKRTISHSREALRKRRHIELGKRKGFYRGFIEDLIVLDRVPPSRHYENGLMKRRIKRELVLLKRQMKLFSEKRYERYHGIVFLLLGLTWKKFEFRQKASMIRNAIFSK